MIDMKIHTMNLRRGRGVFGLAVCALMLVGCGDATEVVVVSDQVEANRIIVELEARNIDDVTKTTATQGRDTVYSIMVPAEHAQAARKILVELNLPRAPHKGLASLVDNQGLIPTRTDERARLMYAQAGEIAQTLELFDGVVDARVHVVIPDTEMSLNDDPENMPKPRAAAVIKYKVEVKAEDDVPARLIEAKPPMEEQDVKNLLIRSVEGLSEEEVTVQFTPTPVPARGAVAVTASASGDGSVIDTVQNMDAKNKKLLYQLFAAVVVLSLLCVFLAWRLIKKPKATPTPVATG